MRIQIRIAISIIVGMIAAYFNNAYIYNKNIVEYKREKLLIYNFNKIKNELEINILEKKLQILELAIKNPNKFDDCVGLKGEISVTNNGIIQINITGKGEVEKSLNICEKAILFEITQSLNKVGLGDDFKLFQEMEDVKRPSNNSLAPYLLFLITTGVIFLLTGIKRP